MKRIAGISLLSAIGCVLAPAVGAQQAASSDTAIEGGIESIVVTAQRREENSQDVPIAITAISGKALEEAGLSTTQDLPALSPGLVITEQRAAAQVYLRGVGAQNTSPAAESSVPIYVDGVYYAAPAAAVFSFNNIDRVEVLKGPQGTLFGRNATGGLVHVITRDPSHTPTFKAGISAGNYQTWTSSLYASGGISDDLAADVSVYITDQGKGFGRNVNTGEDVNWRKDVAARSKWLWTPGEKTQLTVTFDYDDLESDLSVTRSPIPGTTSIGGATKLGGFYDSQSNLPPDGWTKQWGVSARLRHEFDAFDFISTTAYRDLESYTRFDQDAGQFNFIDGRTMDLTETFQQELLLTGGGDRLDWTAGAFFFYADAGWAPLSLRSDFSPTQRLDRRVTQETHSYAVFGQGTYRLTDATRLTVGARYTRDERDLDGRDIAAAGHPSGEGTIIGPRTVSASWNEPTWRLALDHDLTDDMLVYATLSRGFKSGEFSTTAFRDPAVNPELLDAVEVGMKSDLLDHRLRLNASAFYYQYDDIQLQRSEAGVTRIFNAAEAEMKGVEFELVAAPDVSVGSLELRAGGSWLDSEYSRFPNGPATQPNPNSPYGNITVPADLSGKHMVRAPRYTYSLGGRYEVPVGLMSLAFNVSLFHTDEFFWSVDNRVKQEPYDLLNAEVSLAINDHWTVKVFGRNLLDEEYMTGVSADTLTDAYSPGFPLTYGIGVNFDFGR